MKTTLTSLCLLSSVITFSQTIKIGGKAKHETKTYEVPQGRKCAIIDIKRYGIIKVYNQGEVETTISLFDGTKGFVEIEPKSKEWKGEKIYTFLPLYFGPGTKFWITCLENSSVVIEESKD